MRTEQLDVVNDVVRDLTDIRTDLAALLATHPDLRRPLAMIQALLDADISALTFLADNP